jgi:hypothetical protein
VRAILKSFAARIVMISESMDTCVCALLLNPAKVPKLKYTAIWYSEIPCCHVAII